MATEKDLLELTSERLSTFNGLFNLFTSHERQKEVFYIIEKEFCSNLAELYRARIISLILKDPALYDSVKHNQCVNEILKLKEVLSFDEIKGYLIMKLNIEEDHSRTIYLIENVFTSPIKKYLIEREIVKGPRKIAKLDKKIRREWEELGALVVEEDLLSYVLMVLRAERSKQ